MSGTRLLGLILIIGGVLAVGLGGFTYTKDTKEVKLGPVELSLQQKETINIPLWAGIAAVVGGGLLLAFARK